jgi:hypothetical protein
MRRLVWRWGKEEDDWTVFGFTHVHFGSIPAAPFLELTKKAANKLRRHFCPETADQMDEGYVDPGFGGGKDDFIDTMIGEISEDDGQLYLETWPKLWEHCQ